MSGRGDGTNCNTQGGANSPYLVEKSSVLAEICPTEGAVKTHFTSIVLTSSDRLVSYLTGMVSRMCTLTTGALTLTMMLQDPLIRLVMHSDNVSEEDHSELLYRVKQLLSARAEFAQPRLATVA
jgi:hypothetical protein